MHWKAAATAAPVVLVGVLDGRGERIDPIRLLYRRQAAIGCLFGAMLHEPDGHALVSDLLAQAAAGRFKVPIDRRVSLKDAAAAHAYAETRRRIGRGLPI